MLSRTRSQLPTTQPWTECSRRETGEFGSLLRRCPFDRKSAGKLGAATWLAWLSETAERYGVSQGAVVGCVNEWEQEYTRRMAAHSKNR